MTNNNPELSICIPCYNEEDVIAHCYQSINHVVTALNIHYEIIFCNDGSTDTSLKKLAALQKDPHVNVIHSEVNKGVGYASRLMYQAAKGRYIIQSDADLSIDPKIIPAILDSLKVYDIVIASRYIKVKPDYPKYRIILSKVFNGYINFFFHLGVCDTESGTWGFRRSVLENFHLKLNGFESSSEFFIQAKANNFTMKEIPAKYIYRKYGAKSSVLKNGPKALLNILNLWWHRKDLLKK